LTMKAVWPKSGCERITAASFASLERKADS
jgi:hypothetical protein